MGGASGNSVAVRAGGRLCAVVLWFALALTTATDAGPREDAQALATAIQERLDARDATGAEPIARQAVARAEAELGAAALETANLYRLLGDTLYDQERYGEAEPFFRKALSIRDAASGPDTEDVAHSATDLALTLKALERFDEAEPLYLRALAIRERIAGPDSEPVARSLLRLSRMEAAQGDHAEAAGFLSRAVAAGEKSMGALDRTVVLWMCEWAQTLHDSGSLAEAEPVYRRAIAAAEATLPADETDLANVRHGLANLLRQTGRPTQAEPLYRLVLPIWQDRLGAEHPKVAATLESLGATIAVQDRPREAMEIFGAAMAIREKTDSSDSERVARLARQMASVALALDRNADAEILQKRALAHSESHPGQEAQVLAYDLLALGTLYAGQKRTSEAEPLLTRAIAVFAAAENTRRNAIEARAALAMMKDTTGDSTGAALLLEAAIADLLALPDGDAAAVAAGLELSLARIRLQQGQLAEASRLLARFHDTTRGTVPDVRRALMAASLGGDIALRQGRIDEALSLFLDVLARVRDRYGDASPALRSALGDVARVHFAKGSFREAVALFEQSVAITDSIAAIDVQAAFSERTGAIEDSAIARAGEFDFLVKAYFRLAQADPAQAQSLSEKAFLVAQRVIDSQAATAITQTAARQASGTGELAGLVRERQDRLTEWRIEDRRRTVARAAVDAGSNAVDLAAIDARLQAADGRIRAIDLRLAEEFPAFASFQKPAVSVFAQVREKLGDDEVMLFFAETSRRDGTGFETYLWAVPRTGEVRWHKLARSTTDLSADVRRLRSLMGVGAETRGAKSLTVAGETDRAGEIIDAAGALFRETLGPVADVIDGKSLFVIPSKKLAGLPFHLLVTGPAASTGVDRFRAARWLVHDHAITVLPSVSAMTPSRVEALRDVSRRTYLGFADPLLTGRSGEDRRAFARQSCDTVREAAPLQIASADKSSVSTLMRGAAADVDAIRRLEPLPETTDEVCAVARRLGAGEESLRLGAAATEAEVKRLSEDGRLSQASILHFATHGLVSGDLQGLAEPAIVLTPPDNASERDDGLLTASEVTTLRLDAEWVILSACNTAAGDGGGEALSGLARAFFYAGARSLMVSHWPVNSQAAVSLATGAIDAMTDDPTIDPAEALRRSMLAEIEKGEGHADPANWAPFILVGAAR